MNVEYRHMFVQHMSCTGGIRVVSAPAVSTCVGLQRLGGPSSRCRRIWRWLRGQDGYNMYIVSIKLIGIDDDSKGCYTNYEFKLYNASIRQLEGASKGVRSKPQIASVASEWKVLTYKCVCEFHTFTRAEILLIFVKYSNTTYIYTCMLYTSREHCDANILEPVQAYMCVIITLNPEPLPIVISHHGDQIEKIP